MDSHGRLYMLEEDGPARSISEQVSDVGRGHLVLAALDAGEAAGWPQWWPELAPLNKEEREIVMRQRAASPQGTDVD